MGLLDKLVNQGSPLSAANGGPISVNPLATAQSKLHADNTQPGYSVDGSNFGSVNNAYQQYNDGAVNVLPMPSQLDPSQPPTQYLNNLPQ